MMSENRITREKRVLSYIYNNKNSKLERFIKKGNQDLYNYVMESSFMFNGCPANILKTLICRNANICFDENFSLRWSTLHGRYTSVHLLLSTGRFKDISERYYAPIRWSIKQNNKRLTNLLLKHTLPLSEKTIENASSYDDSLSEYNCRKSIFGIASMYRKMHHIITMFQIRKEYKMYKKILYSPHTI